MEAQIMLLANNINSNDKEKVIESTVKIRKLLSIVVDPPIDMIVNIGIIVPRLIKFLDESSLPNLQFEAAWCLTNIASGTDEHCKCIVDYGAIPALLKLLNQTQEINIIEQVIWAFGCISGDSILYRDKILETNTLSYIINVVNDFLTTNIFGFQTMSIRTMAYTLSNLMRNKPKPPYEIINPALPVLVKLIYSLDQEIMLDALWALNYYSDSCTKEIIGKILETGISKRLIELLTHSLHSKTPALLVICNLLTGDDTQTQVLLNLNILPHFEILLKSPNKKIRKDVCLAISNITAGTPSQIQQVLTNKTIMQTIIDVLTTKTPDNDIMREACWCISNIIKGGSSEQIGYLFFNFNCINIFCDLLYKDDIDNDIVLLSLTLNAIAFIIQKGESNVKEGIFKENEYLTLIEYLGGINKIEALQAHPSDGIYQKALEILTLIGIEGEDENQDDSVLNGIAHLNIKQNNKN